MAHYVRPAVTAVLGPTNTGKTHLAVERLCGHSSGIIGFPLRLLAREIYDRVVAIKGGNQVALLTGEERIVPPKARYYLCTAESMPVLNGRPSDEAGAIDAAFVAIDEAQLGVDPERGHVFTDRLLNARGREETMILGSESLRPLVKALVPDADIVTRPRFSTLSYAGPARLARLPKRSVVVAFSAEQVYAIAETLRRFKGGAAIVMGALSPRTRNAQVAMFQAGEVDYLVATDAIGMGLNLDVGHVAFAGLSKFDGKRTRRLTLPEMAQIAGRAGRHQRDGSFGSIGGEAKPGFTPEEIAGIEDHRFAPLDHLYWRSSDPRFDDIATLIADLEAPPERRELRAAPLATDLAVLKLLADDPAAADRATSPAMVARLWEVCGLPDFQKTGAWHHARTVEQLWRFRSSGNGTIERGWYASRLERLDSVEGDIEAIAARIAAVRTWAYIAHRADWLDDPAEMTMRSSEIEAGLSDALHEKLTQRFVDRRTSVLLRDLGKGAAALPVSVATDGAVSVDGEPIGSLAGFRFSVDAGVRASDRKLLLAAADRHLAKELRARARALGHAGREDMALAYQAGEAPRLTWRGHAVATLAKGRDLLHPEIRLDASVAALDKTETAAIAQRLREFVDAEIERLLAPLAAADALSRSPDAAPELRAVLAPLVDAGGILPRTRIEPALRALGKDGRGALRPLKLVIGTLDIFMPPLLKPAAAELRAALLAAQREKPLLPLPAAGIVIMTAGEASERMGAQVAGFRVVGDQLLRIDLVERLARQAHDHRVKAQPAKPPKPAAVSDATSAAAAAPNAKIDESQAADTPAPAAPVEAKPAEAVAPAEATPDVATVEPASEAAAESLPPGQFDVPTDLATSLGLKPEAYAALMRDMGFRRVERAPDPVAEPTPEPSVAGEGQGEAGPEAATPAAKPPIDKPVVETIIRWTWRGLRAPAVRTRPPRPAKPAAAAKPPRRGSEARVPSPPRPAPRPKPAPSSARATANPFADLKDMLKSAPKDRSR